MKKFSSLLVAAVLSFGTFSSAFATDTPVALFNADAAEMVTEERWDAFSDRLVEALASDNVSIQQSALRLVIQYGEKLDVRDGVFDVVRMYRDGSDKQLRRMAVVALVHMDSKWAVDFLKRSAAYEKNETIRRTIVAAVAETNA